MGATIAQGTSYKTKIITIPLVELKLISTTSTFDYSLALENTLAPTLINPANGLPLLKSGEYLNDSDGNSFPIVNGIPRFVDSENYTKNFGLQWNKFNKVQLDNDATGLAFSRDRFFFESNWHPDELRGKNILEVGSGAGRFSKTVLEHTEAHLCSVDFSEAVNANFQSNRHLAPDRFLLVQANIYNMPFSNNSFDKIFCFGVLQHTPDFERSIKALLSKAKSGGEVVVDFYPIKGWWTKLHAKYLLRPFTKRMKHSSLLALIYRRIDFYIRLYKIMQYLGITSCTRFLPMVDLRTIPRERLSPEQLREWIVLDTFDMFSPEHDHPQRINDVASMFRRNGATVTYAGFIRFGNGFEAAVVRAIKL